MINSAWLRSGGGPLAAALLALGLGCSRSGGSLTTAAGTTVTGPIGTAQPIPVTGSVIQLPADSYLHPGASTEWWWHMGTLRAADRSFGFEINAASFQNGPPNFMFTQVMLSDLAQQKHYQRTAVYLPNAQLTADNWAQSQTGLDWFATLGSAANQLSVIDVIDPGSGYTSAQPPTVTIEGGGGVLALAVPVIDDATSHITQILLLSPGLGYISEPTVTIAGGTGSGATARAFNTYVAMTAPQGKTLSQISVQALLVDEATKAPVDFNLTFSQQGPPFIVWGTGVKAVAATGTDLQRNNYYYSLTRLQATGTITIAGTAYPVTGTTWMDHEYGGFGSAAAPVKWILQDVQLDNGVCLSSYALVDATGLALGRTLVGDVTVQKPDGTTYFVSSQITPTGTTWTSPDSNVTYYMQFQLVIPAFDATLQVSSLMDAQEFPLAGGPVYEGVARAEGVIQGEAVEGTAWNEQNIVAGFDSAVGKLVPSLGR